MAQCSESTGSIVAPGVERTLATSGAAAMSDSLLARASRFPGLQGRERDRKPGESEEPR